MCNTGSSDITLPSLEMRQPDEGDGYLVVARDLFQGVEALSTHESVPPRACALIAAHALECILKGYLWRKGKRAELRHKDNRHNILALWDLSYKEQTLGISENPPAWVQILSEGHGPNFYFRYQQGVNRGIVHGGANACASFNDREIAWLD
jgi:hypothetical protein